MTLIINDFEKLMEDVYFDGYYIDKEYGVVCADEELLDKRFIKENIRELNGLFNCIIVNDKEIEVWVDRCRSLPIFYINTGEMILISKDFFELYETAVQKGIDLKISDVNANNLIRFGYIPHEETIIHQIKEVPCGTVMRIDRKTRKIEIEKYWEFKYQPAKQFDVKGEAELLIDIYDKVFSDFAKYLNRRDRPVDFAMSGGLDSRIILGGIYKFIEDKKSINLNTFGSIYSEDVQIPYDIAQEKGFNLRHFCISEYDKMFEKNDVMTSATQGRSLSHYQDGFPLVENNKLKPDGVWFFGHTGDFIGGGHISRKVYYSPYEKYAKKFKEFILNKHSFDKSKNKFYGETFKDLESKEAFLSELDRWDMENRQSKFIINDAATYRECGCKVLLPLWDHRIVDYFLRVPYEFKLKRVLYNEVSIKYLEELRLDKDLDREYYKKVGVMELAVKKIKNKIKAPEKYVLSHGFNVFFSKSIVKNKMDEIIKDIQNRGVAVKAAETGHFNYYLALIELGKIISKLEDINVDKGRHIKDEL